MVRPTSVKALSKYRIWLEFDDGVSGEVDLSDMAGSGVFKIWDEPGYFDKVHIAPHRAIAWDDEVELCPDSLHWELASKADGATAPAVPLASQDA
ncbi:MAG: DUF2442 domain-containing protein [Chloroflexota bacterium]|nr:DUF2442 domain-containing protein [Chloroflexota bacterium]MDE2960939.1 DUF2442 domain-containing protein [Chloroflexota bacterium]